MTTVGAWHRFWLLYLLAGFALAFVYVVVGVVADFVAATRVGNDATLSVLIRDVSREYSIIPFAVGAATAGLVAGVAVHWWAAMKQRLGNVPAADLLAELDRRAEELDRPATVVVNAVPGATTIAITDSAASASAAASAITPLPEAVRKPA